MDNKYSRKRGENWDKYEKDILRDLMSKSARIMLNNSNRSTVNMMKHEEWNNITKKFNELTGKNRSLLEVKLSWKRIKRADKIAGNYAVKKDISSETDYETVLSVPAKSSENIPYDIEVMINDNDSDEFHETVTGEEQGLSDQEFTCEQSDLESSASKYHKYNEGSINAGQLQSHKDIKTEFNGELHSDDRHVDNCILNQLMRESIAENKINFMKRRLEMLEELHTYNVQIAKLKVAKLKKEIAALNCPNVMIKREME